MPYLVLLLFIALPIAEIAVLIKVADLINLWPTIALIVLTAVIGVYLLRLQGLSALARAQRTLNEGRLPVDSISDAVGLMLAGAFLLTPGLITDTLGFALLIPAFRHGLAKWLFKRVRRSQNIKVDIFGEGRGDEGGPFDPFGSAPSKRPRGNGPVIEGEIIETDIEADIEPDIDAGDEGKISGDKPSGRSPWNSS